MRSPANSNSVYQWSDLSKQYEWTALILGNGASIAVDDTFAYSSLRAFAADQLAVKNKPLFESLFAKLKTCDFERALLACWHAETVCELLEEPSPKVHRAYQEIRDALIASVHGLHPPARRSTVQNKLERIAQFASTFNYVVTFNYDLLLYWAIMAWNETSSGHIFKDGFTQHDGSFDDNWTRLTEALHDRRPTLVFYGHGNLALARDRRGREFKLKARENLDLLVTIAAEWKSGQRTPVFVSEGMVAEKLNVIHQSPYLRTVYREVLPELGNAIVIYGFGFNDNDEHIMKAILANIVKRGRDKAEQKAERKTLAVAVHTGMGDEDLRRFYGRVKQQVGDAASVLFFDAGSPGVWANAAAVGRVPSARPMR